MYYMCFIRFYSLLKPPKQLGPGGLGCEVRNRSLWRPATSPT